MTARVRKSGARYWAVCDGCGWFAPHTRRVIDRALEDRSEHNRDAHVGEPRDLSVEERNLLKRAA